MASILDMFRKSPFGPLHEHMLKVKECIGLLRPLFEAAVAGDKQKQQEITKRISKTEHEADLIKTEIRRTVPKGIFLPVQREDLLGYLKLQDDIADSIEDASVLLSMKDLPVPPELGEAILAYVDKVLIVCQRTDNATDHLKNLAEAGFGGREAETVVDLVEQAEHAEWEADKAGLELAKKLFALEGALSPTDLFLWFHIFNVLGKIANHAEKTGDRLRRMLHR
jgi:predicted phosphate transport protein (TIGR00153 family)